jgi:hypothetical protein
LGLEKKEGLILILDFNFKSFWQKD